MKNEPNKRDRELDNDDTTVDPSIKDVAEQLEGYQEYMREAKGDSLTYGDY